MIVVNARIQLNHFCNFSKIYPSKMQVGIIYFIIFYYKITMAFEKKYQKYTDCLFGQPARFIF